MEHRPLDEDEIRKIVEQSTRGKKSKKGSKGQADDRASPSSNPPMRTPPPMAGPGGQPQQQPGQPPPGLQPAQAPQGQSGQPMTSAPNSSGPAGMPGFPNGHPAGPYGQPGMAGMYRHGDPNQVNNPFIFMPTYNFYILASTRLASGYEWISSADIVSRGSTRTLPTATSNVPWTWRPTRAIRTNGQNAPETPGEYYTFFLRI